MFACDELAGFITACALVKPGKSLAEVEAASVKKKMKDKAFARSVNRDDITTGAAELGLPLEEHIAFCIEALKGWRGSWGCRGRGKDDSLIRVSNGPLSRLRAAVSFLKRDLLPISATSRFLF